MNDPISKAKELTYDYVKGHLEKTDAHVSFSPEDVYVVLFSYILGGWKAHLSTVLLDGTYYELTHNVVLAETYIDAYKKFDNVCVPDES